MDPEHASNLPVVAMTVRNPVTHDARVLREAQALVDSGYRVIVFGRLIEGGVANESVGGVEIVRLDPSDTLHRFLWRVMRWPLDSLRSYSEWRKKRIAPLRRRWLRIVRRWRLACVAQDSEGTWRAFRSSLGGVRRSLIAAVFLPLLMIRRARPHEPAAAPVSESSPLPPTRLLPWFVGTARFLEHVMRGPVLARFAWQFQRMAGAEMAARKPVAYHCHDFATIWSGIIASKRWRAPIIYDAHELYAHQNIRNMTRRRRTFVMATEWRVTRRAAAVITVNKSIASWLSGHYRIEMPTVVMNVPSTSPPGSAIEIPRELTTAGYKILYVGSITTGRGIESAVRALKAVPSATLILMGPVNNRDFADSIRSLAAEVGVDERLVFIPPVPHEQVTAVAARATVGLVLIKNVCLSYYLSLPNKMFECMHAGLPVVASDFPEIREVVSTFEIGTLCDPDDPEAIARAINAILDDPEERARMSKNGIEASRIFTWEAEREKLINLYAKVAPASAATAP